MQNCLLTHRPAAPAHFDEKASRVLRFIRQLRHLHMTLSAIRPLTRTIFQSCHSTVYDALMRPGRVWLFASDPDQLNSTTIALWTTVANLTQSSRALGWDTNDQSYAWCGSFSKKAFLHIGYTGTELCADPEVGVATVLLTNGKYPNRDTGMVWYRPQFNSMIHELLVAGWSSSPRGSSDGMTSEQIAFSAGGGALILVLVLVAAARMVKRGGCSAADRRDELLISEQSLGRKNID